jgi:hypothetical protein
MGLLWQRLDIVYLHGECLHPRVGIGGERCRANCIFAAYNRPALRAVVLRPDVARRGWRAVLSTCHLCSSRRRRDQPAEPRTLNLGLFDVKNARCNGGSLQIRYGLEQIGSQFGIRGALERR